MADVTQPNPAMLYSSIVPINRDSHGDVGIDTGPERYAFARSTHLVPALLDEFVIGGRSLPIVFTPGLEAPTAVFLTGTAAGRSTLVAPDGRWLGRYVPAYLRRYPFIIGQTGSDEAFLCFDERWSGCRSDGGEPLFSSGVETSFLRAQLDFSSEYLAAARRTEEFIRLISDIKLLKGIDITFGRDGESKQSIHGLFVIDEEKLNRSSSAQMQELRPYLAAIYAQLHSLQSLEVVSQAISPAN